QGRLQAVFNLTSNDLANEMNRATLKQLFLDAAKIVDSDHDQLPDDWEMKYFGNLNASPSADSDRDGYDNFTEYAFGTNPLDPTSRPTPKITKGAQVNVLNMTFQHRAGAYLDYSTVELDDLNGSPASGSGLSPAEELRNLFDGSGTVEAKYSISASAPYKFIRIRAVPRYPGSTGIIPGGP